MAAVAVRGGGHNVSGNAVCDDGVLIDFSLRRESRSTQSRDPAVAEPGVLLGEFDRAERTSSAWTHPPEMYCSTGLAGLSLGGGFGPDRVQYGPTRHNLISAQLVTADGERDVAQ